MATTEPAAARQPLEVPFPVGKGAGQVMGLLTFVLAILPGRGKCPHVGLCSLMWRYGSGGQGHLPPILPPALLLSLFSSALLAHVENM